MIDQYQVSTDKRSGIYSDRNRPDDEQYVVRLVRQVVWVSVETVRVVTRLPAEYDSTTAVATDGSPGSHGAADAPQNARSRVGGATGG